MAILDRRKDRFIDDQDKRVSVGIEFPFGKTTGDGYFKSTKTTVESIKNNIKLLLQTHQGERVFQPFLGMKLRELMFEQLTDETLVLIENNIVDVFLKWLPFVNIRDIQVNQQNELSQVNVKIIFSIQRAPNSLESVEVAFDGVGAGTSSTTETDGAY